MTLTAILLITIGTLGGVILLLLAPVIKAAVQHETSPVWNPQQYHLRSQRSHQGMRRK